MGEHKRDGCENQVYPRRLILALTPASPKHTARHRSGV